MAVSTSLIHSYQFLPRNAIHSADYAVARCMSVRLSHAGIVSKLRNVSSNFFTAG